MLYVIIYTISVGKNSAVITPSTINTMVVVWRRKAVDYSRKDKNKREKKTLRCPANPLMMSIREFLMISAKPICTDTAITVAEKSISRKTIDVMSIMMR